MEATNPGLLYVAISRGTTMGDPDNLMSSAIYFFGSNMTKERLRGVNRMPKERKDATHLPLLSRREQWVKYLKEHQFVIEADDIQIDTLLQKAEQKRLTQADLFMLVTGN